MSDKRVSAKVKPFGRWLWYITLHESPPPNEEHAWIGMECGHAFRLGRRRADRKAARMVHRRVTQNYREATETHEVQP